MHKLIRCADERSAFLYKETNENMLSYCNPSLSTEDWRVIRLERTEKPYRQALILLKKQSLAPLNIAKWDISYGFERMVLRILPTESRVDGPLPPSGAE